jgi:hypothetical protein
MSDPVILRDYLDYLPNLRTERPQLFRPNLLSIEPRQRVKNIPRRQLQYTDNYTYSLSGGRDLSM